MLLPHNTGAGVLARALLCAASRQAVLMCTLPPRCLPKSCTRVQCQGVHTGFTLEHARQHWWPAQQSQSGIARSYHVRQGVTACDMPQRNTENIIRKQAYSTSKAGGLDQASDMTEKEEVDLEALIELELELYRQEGFPVPSEITSPQWQELLTKGTVSARKKYLTFLFKNEMKRKNKRKLKDSIRKQKEEEERQKRENPVEEDRHIEYGLWKNSIFIKILETSMNHFYHTRVVQAMLHGQPLIVDLDFEEHMSSKERQNCAYQIQMMISANRKHEDPYSLEIHNAPPTLDTMARLERYIPPLHKPEYPLIINPKSYLQKYPKEQLVYLTPHCQEELLVYDHNAVYIIGGIVDKSSGEPLTLAKAKREGVRMQKLPLDRYLAWGIGNKCLTLNQIINIMLDFKMTGDWPHAFRHVPRRKLQLPPWNQQIKEESLLKKIQRRQRSSRNH
ncbi:mitochondrial ribonuclease P protein 1 homolog isoform X1 [Scylla paramamosain]|uniref:mitochondrial ribonuclease P protein 1 homolog isoform X1 n=2 Tax=Scylla paramamosain TaxID=85552 RepID=UPI003082B906